MISESSHSSSSGHPIYGEYDVVVSGGGLIGLICATAIARTGRKTALVERRSALGWEMGRARRMFANEEQELAASPYARELLSGMSHRPGKDKGLHAPFVELVFDRWVMDAQVDVMFHGWTAGIAQNEGVVCGLVAGTREGYRLLKSPLVIETDDSGRLIDACYARQPLRHPITRSLLIGNVSLHEEKELKLPTGNRLHLKPLTQDQARADLVLDANGATNATHDFHMMIVEAMQLIREQVEGGAEAAMLYAAEEGWQLPAFQLKEGFIAETKPIGRLLVAGPHSGPIMELGSNQLAVSRSRGLLLAGPWLPCYMAASAASESTAIMNRFLLGEAVAAFAIANSKEDIWGQTAASL